MLRASEEGRRFIHDYELPDYCWYRFEGMEREKLLKRARRIAKNGFYSDEDIFLIAWLVAGVGFVKTSKVRPKEAEWARVIWETLNNPVDWRRVCGHEINNYLARVFAQRDAVYGKPSARFGADPERGPWTNHHLMQERINKTGNAHLTDWSQGGDTYLNHLVDP